VPSLFPIFFPFIYLAVVCGQLLGRAMNDETTNHNETVWHACLLDQYGNAHPFRK